MTNTIVFGMDTVMQLDFAEKAWNRIGRMHHHGVAVPLFSLRTKNSLGIGEYLDLIPLIQWCSEVGMDVIQLLPINDTGLDSSPYNLLSSCALSTAYLSLKNLPGANLRHPSIKILKGLNETPRVAQWRVRAQKKVFLEDYLKTHRKEILHSAAFNAFIVEHPWLNGYARFKALWERNGGVKPSRWAPVPLHLPKEELEDQKILQFLCFEQMKTVKTEANKRGVFLMGDLPILLNKASSDVWLYPHLFNPHATVGVPPDQFNPYGQNWRFPVCRWKAMFDDDLQWWKMRLKVAEKLYDIFRIDHIIGLFNQYAIPEGKTPAQGKFMPKNRDAWIRQGRKILREFVRTTTMLPIGEDLGIVPHGLRDIMAELGIASTKVLRWEHPHDFAPLCLSTVSTHDVEPLPLWWRNRPEEAKKYATERNWRWKKELDQETHMKILKECHSKSSLFHVNLLQEYLTLFPSLCSPNLQDERINTPGIVCPLNWSSRYRHNIEEMAEHAGLRETLLNLIN